MENPEVFPLPERGAQCPALRRNSGMTPPYLCHATGESSYQLGEFRKNGGAEQEDLTMRGMCRMRAFTDSSCCVTDSSGFTQKFLQDHTIKPPSGFPNPE